MKFVLLPALAVSIFGLSACGSSSHGQDTPVACLGGAKAFEQALDQLPAPARLDGGTKISDCLPDEQSAGDLANVGSALIEAADDLNAKARKSPGGEDNVALGYLLGAVHGGAGATGGIHAALVSRVDVAAHYSPGGKPLPPQFGIALAKGSTQGAKTG